MGWYARHQRRVIRGCPSRLMVWLNWWRLDLMFDAKPVLVRGPCALKVGHARISLNEIFHLLKVVNNLILQGKKGAFCALCSFKNVRRTSILDSSDVFQYCFLIDAISNVCLPRQDRDFHHCSFNCCILFQSWFLLSHEIFVMLWAHFPIELFSSLIHYASEPYYQHCRDA